MSSYFTQNLQEDEIVVKMIRKHPIGSLKWFIIGLVLIVLPFALIKYLLASGWGTLIFVALIILALLYAFLAFLRWYFDSVIITDRRVINIDQKGIFQREVREIAYDKIGDVGYGVKGVLATSLNFGSLTLTLTDEKIILEKLPKPGQLAETLKNLITHYHKEHGKGEMTATDLVKIIQKASGEKEDEDTESHSEDETEENEE
ncbi:PH domain-containing protein [Patescibacteria group bacterium]